MPSSGHLSRKKLGDQLYYCSGTKDASVVPLPNDREIKSTLKERKRRR